MSISVKFKIGITQVSLFGVAIAVLIITLSTSLPQATQLVDKFDIIYDKKVISAFQNISLLVPKDELIITPSQPLVVKYFTNREVYIPESVKSYKSLLNLMNSSNYDYLLIFENQSEIGGLVQVFQKQNLPNLSKDFREIGLFTTEFNKIHLYKRLI